MSGWLFKKKSITMHGNMNVKFMDAECFYGTFVATHLTSTQCHSL